MAEPRTAIGATDLRDLMVTKGQYLIGLTDFAHEGQYVWETDNSTTEYTNGEDGQPDQFDKRENGVVAIATSSMNWNDIPCKAVCWSDLTYTVCQKWTSTNETNPKHKQIFLAASIIHNCIYTKGFDLKYMLMFE